MDTGIRMKTIGKYEIRGLLGKGGMGKVYKVALPVVGRIVALKLLEPNPFLVDLIGEKKIRDLFVSEAITIAGIFFLVMSLIAAALIRIVEGYVKRSILH